MAAAAVSGFFRRQGEKFVGFCKDVARDYKTVALDTVQDAKDKPVKAAFIGSMLAGLTYAYKTNPSQDDMLNELRHKRQQMVLVPNSQHNLETDKELATRSLLLCQNRLHYYDLWFFSLLVRSVHDDKARIHSTQDSNLRKWPWEELYENFVDIGYLGKWHNLTNVFKEYDLNQEELSEHSD